MSRKVRFPKRKRIDGKIFTLHSSYIRKTGSIQQEKKRWKANGYNVRIIHSGGHYALYRRKK